MLTAVKDHMQAQMEAHLETLWRLTDTFPHNTRITAAVTMVNDVHTSLSKGDEVSVEVYALAMAEVFEVYALFKEV